MPVVAIDNSVKPDIVSKWHSIQMNLRRTIDRQTQMWLTECIELGIDQRLILNTSL